MDDYDTDDHDYLRTKQCDDDYWGERIRRQRVAEQNRTNPQRTSHNPNAEPCGHFTGRCAKCGSTDLWDDNAHYGCNSCGAFLA